AIHHVCGCDTIGENAVMLKIFIIAATCLKAIAIAAAGATIFQYPVAKRPAVFIIGGDVVCPAQVAVPTIVQVLPGTTADEFISRACIKLTSKAIGILYRGVGIIKRITVENNIVRSSSANLQTGVGIFGKG